jgi:hypothetical protein
MCIPLARARICIDCENIFHENYTQCPSCTSEQIFPISSWLETTKQGSESPEEPDSDRD